LQLCGYRDAKGGIPTQAWRDWKLPTRKYHSASSLLQKSSHANMASEAWRDWNCMRNDVPTKRSFQRLLGLLDIIDGQSQFHQVALQANHINGLDIDASVGELTGQLGKLARPVFHKSRDHL